jgi:hypothetical protein
MEPTPAPATPPTPPAPDPAAANPVVEYFRTQRVNAAYLLLAQSLVFLVLAGWFGVRGFRATGDPGAADTEAKDKAGKLGPRADLTGGLERDEQRKGDYRIAMGAAATGFLILGVVGAWVLVAPARPTVAGQRAEARKQILAYGTGLGVVLILTGAAFFYRWSDSLFAWLERDESGQMKWVVIPLLMVIAGAGLVFASIQPARAEERNNPALRRLVYGSNFAVTALLVFVALVIANIVLGLKLPNRLDTTASGFYSLTDETRRVIEGLDQTVTAYAILPSGEGEQVVDDIRRLLQSCQDVNPARFKVRFLSPTFNQKEVAELKAQFPQAELSQIGVLLVVGDESEPGTARRHTFLRDDEFLETDEAARPGARSARTFNGEQKLLRELRFLADNKNKPVVYFTQSSGELALSAGGPGGRPPSPRRAATGLKQYLEKNYVDVRVLPAPTPGAPVAIPDDAAVVVVADPTETLPPATVEAITKYMQQPRGDRKGKLVLLAGQQPGPDLRMLRTGLEPLLMGHGITLGDRFLFTVPEQESPQAARQVFVEVTQAAIDARNPVALGFRKLIRVPMLDCREVTAARGGATNAVPVLETTAGRVTWTTTEAAENPLKVWVDLNVRTRQLQEKLIVDKVDPKERAVKMREFLAPYQITEDSRDVAAFASEGATARVAVFGNGWFVSDDATGQASQLARSRGGRFATLWLDLIGSTLDWIRDRPPLPPPQTIKRYEDYQLTAFDFNRGVLLPLGLALLIILGLGVGVWVIRRK